ncbi:MAG: hypothetical protein QN183_05450 [Armatimonadota bacterium]|nr:hypothetical protein [Armatimonadota bacterium]MDR7534483.1 hypothetical protein [Armatimonadota bacterium]MDR7535792.1 hypothetical protein [Armatimonadota bacterium]
MLAVAAGVVPWVEAHTATYQVHVPPRRTVEVTFPLPPRAAAPGQPLTFTWSFVRPSPPPPFVFLERCTEEGRCVPVRMRASGQAGTVTGRPVKIINESARAVEILFWYTIWAAGR